MPTGWESFYLLVGGAAGALIGLLFVVITLTAELDAQRAAIGSKVYVTPIVFHFGTAFLVSAAALVPPPGAHVMGVFIGAPAVFGIGYSLLTFLRLARRLPNPPHWSDWFYYGLFPGSAYVGLLIGAEGFWSGRSIAADAVAAASVALLLIGIRDAWDVATWIQAHPEEGSE